MGLEACGLGRVEKIGTDGFVATCEEYYGGGGLAQECEGEDQGWGGKSSQDTTRGV